MSKKINIRKFRYKKFFRLLYFGVKNAFKLYTNFRDFRIIIKHAFTYAIKEGKITESESQSIEDKIKELTKKKLDSLDKLNIFERISLISEMDGGIFLFKEKDDDKYIKILKEYVDEFRLFNQMRIFKEISPEQSKEKIFSDDTIHKMYSEIIKKERNKSLKKLL